MKNITEFTFSEVIFEEFLIEYYTNILREIKRRRNRKFKVEIIEKLLQKNLFLLRRLKDPGFQRFLSKEILKDIEFFKIATQYIKRIISTKLMNSNFFFDPFSKKEDWFPFYKPEFTPIFPTIEELSRIKSFSEKVKEYLEHQLNLAKIDGDLEKIKAIEVLMKDYDKMSYSMRELLIDPFSSDPITMNFILKYETILKNQKLKLNELYNKPPRNIFYSDFFLYQSPENEELIIEIVNIISNFLEVPKEQVIVLNKMIKDLIVIIQFKWFDLKTAEDKWKILDAEYYYILSIDDYQHLYNIFEVNYKKEIDKNLLKQFFEQMYDIKQIKKEEPVEYFVKEYESIHSIVSKKYPIIYNVIMACYRNGYYQNCINGYNFLLSLKLKPELNAFFYNNIGFIHLEQWNYQEALNYFKNAFNSIPDDFPHIKTVIQKNLGECHYNLGELSKCIEIFNEIEKFALSLDDIPKYRSLYNLGCSYENVGKFNQACELFLKITSSDLKNKEIMDQAYEKFEFYERFRRDDYSLDLEQIKDSFSSKFLRKIRIFFLKQKNQFQFRFAERIMKSGLDYAKKAKITITINLIFEELAEFYILTKNLKGFCELFSDLDFEIRIPKIHIFNGVYLFLQGDIEESVKIFSKFYQDYLNIDHRKFLLYLSPIYELLPSRISPDIEMPPILWYIKPLLDFGFNLNDNFIERIIDTQDRIDGKGAILVDIGQIYDQCKSIEESLNYYEMASKYVKNDINRHLVIISNITGVYASLDDFEKAKDHINGILRIFDKERINKEIKSRVAEHILVNIALFYESIFDFPNAIKIINKALNFSDNPDLIEKKKEFEKLNQEFLYYNAIDDSEVKNLLFTSDMIFKKISETSLEIDYSLIILGYCKAIEILLDKKITKNIDLTDILEPFYENKNSKRIRDDVWKSLPFVLKVILDLSKSKSIGIGQWVFILKNLLNKNYFKKQKPIYFEFLCRIEKLLNEQQVKIIKQACENLFELRNQSVHTKFHSKDDFLVEKPRIVSNVNNIMSIFQKT